MEWKGTLLRPDPASGVYLPEGYRPPQEIVQVAAAGPFEVEVRRTVINLHPSDVPLVLRYDEPQKRVDLRYRQHRARITPGSGELLSQFALWRMLE